VDDARRRLQGGAFDLIILDRLLDQAGVAPDGLELAKSLRAAGNQTPLIVLSNLYTTTDQITGHDAGADNYLRKPFSGDMLLSIANRLLKRAAMQKPADALVVGKLDIRLMSRTVQWDGVPFKLTDKEFDILQFLAENCDVVQSREQLWRAVWPDQFNVPPRDNVIDVNLTRLREKLRDATGGRSLIETEYRKGFILRSPING
jgi:DNA-binding response OmpR family regulator